MVRVHDNLLIYPDITCPLSTCASIDKALNYIHNRFSEALDEVLSSNTKIDGYYLNRRLCLILSEVLLYYMALGLIYGLLYFIDEKAYLLNGSCKTFGSLPLIISR